MNTPPSKGRATSTAPAAAAAAAPTASSLSSPSRRHPGHGLSPRQRRLLQASARARARASAAATPTGTVGSSNNNVEGAGPSSPTNDGVMKGGSSTPTKQEAQSEDSAGSGSGSGASTAALTEASTTAASLERGVRRLQFKSEEEEGSSSMNVNTNGGRAPLYINNSNDSRNSSSNNNHRASSPATATKKEGGEAAHAMRGRVGDRIRAWNHHSGGSNNDIDNEKGGSVDAGRRIALDKHAAPNAEISPDSPAVGNSTQEEKGDGAKGPLHEQIMREERDVIAPHPTNNHPGHARHSRGTMGRRNPPARMPSDEIMDDEPTRQEWKSTGPREGNFPMAHSHNGVRRRQQQQQPTTAWQQPKSPPPSSSKSQQQRCPSDEIQTDPNNMRCYRITFRGTVALLSEEELFDGEGRATSNEGASAGKQSLGTQYVGHGEIVGTRSPEFTIPVNHRPSRQEEGVSGLATTTFVRAIRVDSVLTGGYAHDRASANVAGNANGPNCSTDESEGVAGPYGYLILSNHHDRDEQTIAEPLSNSASESLCHSTERGAFLYRVAASSPLPVLSGPSPDAPSLGMGLLPGTSHAVSLRIAMPLQLNCDGGGESDAGDLVDDADAGEVRYLKLAARRGWVADRRVDDVDRKLRVSYLMEDVTPGDDGGEGFPGSVGGGPTGRSGAVDASLSTSFEDASSLNSSALNSTADSSFYASVVASSVATPRAVQSRRRRNKRRPPQRTERSPQPPLSTAFPTMAVGESSFEEAGSSITGVGDGSMSISMHDDSLVQEEQGTQPPNSKSYYLMRVTAPAGLKILDAPHFQVSNLIHHHGPSPARAHTSPGTSPFARTNAMISHSTENSPTMGVRKRSSPGVRYLARGRIFEASSRMEVTDDNNLYTNGQGLIKLADDSGWAIIPHQEDLVTQFRTCGENVSHDSVRAYEEIGNATVRATAPSDRSPDDVVWMRIVPPLGVKVLLPPEQKQATTESQQKGDSQHTTPPKPPNPPSTATSHESIEAASVASSSFFDAVWSRVSVTPTKDKGHRPAQSSQQRMASSSSPKQQQLQQPMLPIIPCGMVVPTEKWEPSGAAGSNSFVRLFNGQGWIPRHLGDTTYAYEVDAPDVKMGSFWFRVVTTSGLCVRHGPLRDAPVIKSDSDTSFRFECGEFLRASELVAMRERSRDNDVGGESAPTECFAKLYRRRDRQLVGVDTNNSDSSMLLGRYTSLHSFANPGEWIQVRDVHGVLLKEAPAPAVERNRLGWRYAAVRTEGLCIRCGPSVQANATGEYMREGEGFLVSERVTTGADGNDDAATWLRLMDGRGWVQSASIEGEAIAVPSDGRTHSQTHKTSKRIVRQILEKGSRA